jgi:lysozyme
MTQQSVTISDKMIERIKSHEGYRTSPYKDTVDKWTVGYGRNLEDNPLTPLEVIKLFGKTNFNSTLDAEIFFEDLLLKDIEKHAEELEQNLAMFPLCSADEQTVLIDMSFNMGVPSLLSFKGMLHAIDNEDQVQAATELLDSQYAEQVKTRAVDNAKLLAGGRYQEAVDRLAYQNTARYNALSSYL